MMLPRFWGIKLCLLFEQPRAVSGPEEPGPHHIVILKSEAIEESVPQPSVGAAGPLQNGSIFQHSYASATVLEPFVGNYGTSRSTGSSLQR